MTARVPRTRVLCTDPDTGEWFVRTIAHHVGGDMHEGDAPLDADSDDYSAAIREVRALANTGDATVRPDGRPLPSP